MNPPITARRRLYYCFIVALSAATFLALVATALWRMFWRGVHGGRFVSTEPFDGIFGTGALWILSTLSLTLTAWNLARKPYFREFRLLNSNRYAPPGRRFVRVQLACLLIFAFWWLGGGAAFFS